MNVTTDLSSRAPDDAREAIETLFRFLNSYSRKPEQLVAAIGSQHRTLQQLFTGVCVLWFKHLAELPADQFDLRNEASVKLARALQPVLDEVTFGTYQLPLI